MKAGLLILEGNICAGKTSLARDLGKLLNYHVFLEPMVTNPYLERYYKGKAQLFFKSFCMSAVYLFLD